MASTLPLFPPTFYARRPLTIILTIVNAQYSSKLHKLIGTINMRIAKLTPRATLIRTKRAETTKLRTEMTRAPRRLMVRRSVLKSYCHLLRTLLRHFSMEVSMVDNGRYRRDSTISEPDASVTSERDWQDDDGTRFFRRIHVICMNYSTACVFSCFE